MRIRHQFLLDQPLIVVAAVSASALAGGPVAASPAPIVLFALGALLIKPAVWYAMGLYRRYWPNATIADLMAAVLAVSAGSLAVAAAAEATRLIAPSFQIPRAVIGADWLLTLAFITGSRLAVRLMSEAKENRRPAGSNGGASAKPVIIAGAGKAGILVAREMKRNPQLGMQPVGFVDDDLVKLGKQIEGIRVLGPLSSVAQTARSRGASEVIIAIPSAPGRVVRSIAEICRADGIASRTMPGLFELIDGQVSVSRFRQIEITDLLRRNPIGSERVIPDYLAGRTVLVTGGGGSIGSELSRQILRARPSSLVLLGHGENSIYEAQQSLRQIDETTPVVPIIADVRNREQMFRVIDRIRPDAIFHAAAHKHVPLMELNPDEAFSNNVIGTQNVLAAAVASGVERLVFISSDKAVAPSSIMGASKRLAETLVLETGRRENRAFVAVRFGNVLGSRGSVVPLFKAQIERGGPVTITHPEMKRYFMTIPEAVHLVLQAGGMGNGGELFVLNMGEPVRIVDLAEDLIKLSGYAATDIPIVFTGIRTGEKLSEGLWERDAKVESTRHPEILRVTETERCSGPELRGLLDRVAEPDTLYDSTKMRAALSICMARVDAELAAAAAAKHV